MAPKFVLTKKEALAQFREAHKGALPRGDVLMFLTADELLKRGAIRRPRG